MNKACLFAAVLCCMAAFSLSAESARQKTVRVGYYENEVFQEGAEYGAVKRGYA